jgi:capsular polysaccharide biosynthesis protein
MELRAYLETLIKQWRVVVPAFIITLIATIWMTHVQPSIYSSTATFVLSPTADFGDVRSFASGLDTLSRRTEIATTFSYVATSRTVRQAALAKLNLTPEQKQDLSTFSQLVAGTNIMKIVVEARHPGVARDVANAVGEETIASQAG